ncbi:hypothetical protein QC761_702190 [Podospora bellae-mahoneyi]|uniref:Uncharacterized protein n=1 Tax=Podospora bellae-mahoneyi TaxID=2093777 RepID=A0ABR0F7Q3_9PEZI|nr:hypothetical protein QC761_702190 [Podospora bellae-mahoneyi]
MLSSRQFSCDMEGEDVHDPFLWDEERLIQELCHSNRQWRARAPKRPLDLAALEAKLREGGVDGASFLTYPEEFGIHNLFAELGIKILPHQQFLQHIINELKESSARYRDYIRQQDDGDDHGSTYIKREPHPPSSFEPPARGSPDAKPRLDMDRAMQAAIASQLGASGPSGVLSPALSPAVDLRIGGLGDINENPEDNSIAGSEPMDINSASDNRSPAVVEQQPIAPEEPPRKKRRVAPALISSEPMHAKPDEREESPLPVFGQSDDEESMDSDEWEEYQQEKEERERMKVLRQQEAASVLSNDKAQAVIADVIKELEARWVAEQQPKQDRRAHNIWESARRNPNREAYIKSIKKLKDEAAKRIPKFRKQILTEKWKSDEMLRKMASDYLEQSVFEKCYQCWLLGVLESPRRPPKPAALPRPMPRPKKQQELAEDEEDLASSDSETDDFLDDSDDKIMISNDLMEVEPISDFVQEPDTDMQDSSPGKIKTKLALAPSTPRRLASSREVILIEDSPLISPTDVIPEFTDRLSLEKMGEMGTDYWANANDAERLLAAILCQWTEQKRERLLKVVGPFGHKEIWEEHLKPAIDSNGTVARVGTTELLLCQLFDAFLECSAKRLARTTIRKITLRQLEQSAGVKFQTFYNHLKKLLVLFRTEKPHFGHTRSLAPTTPTKSPAVKTPIKSEPSQVVASEKPVEELVSQDPSEGGVPQDPADATLTLADEVEAVLSDEEVPLSKKKRKRKQKVNQEAKNLRVTTQQQLVEFGRRRRRLHEEIATNGIVPSTIARLIVNETKKDDEPLIFINAYTGSRIKDHQIDGVRFMWNQVVVSGQGCLLAHTMGLGKTMQVITLLVVIAEAAASDDPAVVEQIPEKLRRSRTLILCPSGLVDNWVDEVNMWAPEGSLGPVYKVDASLTAYVRVEVVKKWASGGGVLIVGYSLFGNLVEDEELEKLLQEKPNIVVGDETHLIKNQNTKRSRAAAHFHTKSRIAMTGSPLTNNVMDYYAMINWVSPGYLSDIEEFRSRFGNPIKEGLYADSNPSAKRQARKLLVILKETMSPKVHRRDVQVLRDELPTKKEFIIMLPLTPLQRTLYEIYIERINNPTITGSDKSSAQVWSMVAKLGTVLAHPRIFKTVAERQKDAKGKAKSGKSEDEDELILPQDILSELLTPTTCRDIDNDAHSYKIVALMFLLGEFRKVGDKALIFTQSIPALDFLESIFKRRQIGYQRLDGHTPINTRQASINKFNSNDSADVYLISTKAGGVGLNIYGANRVIILDFKYSPTDEQQAIGRAYRLGQTKPVYVYWLMIGGTFEATIHKSAIFKTQLASRVIDKKNPAPYATRFKEYFVPPQAVDQEDLQDAYGQDTVLDALLNSAEVGPLVRKVTSTETFEMEETYELPPEDQEEAKKEVALALLRLTDPEAYGAEKLRLDRERYGWQPEPAVQSNTMGMINKGIGTAQANLAHNSVLPRLRDNFGQMVPSSTTPIPIPRQYLQQYRQLGRPNTLGSAPVRPMLGAAPAPSFTLPNSDLQPVLGSGSFAKYPADGHALPSHATPSATPQANPSLVAGPFGTQPVETLAASNSAPHPAPRNTPPTPAQKPAASALAPPNKAPSPMSQKALSHAHVSGSQQPQSTTPSLIIPLPGASASVTDSARPDLPDLRRIYQALCEEGKEVVFTPDAVMQGVEQALQEKGFSYKTFPARDKWQYLQKCCRLHARFAEAMLSGYIQPDQLATRERRDLQTMVTRLNGLAEDDFKREVWGSQVVRNNQAATVAQQKPRPSSKVKDESRVTKVMKDKEKASGSMPKRPRDSKGPKTPNIGPRPGGRQQPVRPGDSAASPFLID